MQRMTIAFFFAAMTFSSASAIAAIETTILGEKRDLTTYINLPEYVTEEEAAAAFFYTDEGAYAMNDALRNGKTSQIKRYAKRILSLASLVNKSRGKECTFYRFIDEDPELLKQMNTRGQIFVERGFFSATSERYPDDEGHFSNKKYIITGTSSHCADISGFSRYQGESEILFPPGTEFIVTQDRDGKNIYLREK